MKLSIVVILIFLTHLGTIAQTPTSGLQKDKSTPSNTILNKLNINQDPRIDTLLQRHIQMNERSEGMDGYRVEIFFSSGSGSRTSALEVKTEFLKLFPEETAYMTFQTPNFKVRVGDCRTRSEALKLKAKIEKYYPNAFIVPDVIQFPNLYTDKE